jgi:acetyltransferase-like isoleucine patch superfamily enzyme
MKFNNKYQLIGDNIHIGENVKIGDNTVIYENTFIDDGTIIANDCIIGEPSNDYYYNEKYSNARTFIGKNCLIRSHAIIYNGNNIGDKVSTGHRIMLRENNSIGEGTRVGNFSELHGNVKIGIYTSIHSSVCIVENSVIGNFVWISPGTILTNDFTLPSNNKRSPKIGDYSILTVNCIILPGVEIGEHCLIGASTVVTKDVADFSVCVGSPGKIISDVRDYVIKGIKHYPWPDNYDKGMPWEGKGFSVWNKEQNND